MEKEKIGKIQNNPNCIICGQPKTVLFRMIEKGKPSQNITKVCTNPKCNQYINLEEVRNWEIRK